MIICSALVLVKLVNFAFEACIAKMPYEYCGVISNLCVVGVMNDWD